MITTTYRELLEPLLHLPANVVALLIRKFGKFGIDLRHGLEDGRARVQGISYGSARGVKSVNTNHALYTPGISATHFTEAASLNAFARFF